MIDGLPSFVPAGAPLTIGTLPAGTVKVRALHAGGTIVDLPHGRGQLDPGTWVIEARSADGGLLAEDLVTVATHPAASPVPGFVSSYEPAAVPRTLEWLRALRCTVVQAYDWMTSYAEPLPGPGARISGERWRDPLGRTVERAAIRQLAAGLAADGAVLQAYAPVYAADPPFAAAHPDWGLYANDGSPQRLGDLLTIMNPGDENWQRHWRAAHRAALDALGFGGLHLDTYGYPRSAADSGGKPVAMPAAYESFLSMVAAEFGAEVVSFNQVNGVPAAMRLSSPRRFRYVEVWEPNNSWRHLEGLISRSSDGSDDAVVLALYPPVWGGERIGALRSVMLSEAVVTALGASMLVWGDGCGALREAYYPSHERLSPDEAATVIGWHRFALRHRDLFTAGLDTSWLDIGDPNTGVLARGVAPVAPEPLGGSLFARVRGSADLIAVSLLDLTGSARGRWDEPASPPVGGLVTLEVVVDDPGGWRADVAAVGRAGGRFTPVHAETTGHREGVALRMEVPLDGGWAVVRLRRTATKVISDKAVVHPT
jgi:dextranase